ncbi:hypothetical protein [Bifidobacterium aerophilum]|uniref:Uncharacterized protein n=1 Tax=Bifidobacterium aerophilum TaxID=1798155 RepID=A0A6N9Z6E9_9BIFI|nr:hypothetical protein [Bifidobacterium aerophilum]NEG90198.1 hypothetical protein [Bifidobacterium aerophilum]
MSETQQAYATMITNFDSTEQRDEWDRIAQGFAGCPTPDALWRKDAGHRTCERLLNDHTEFATRFAGIIRTAYLYCPRIMLTDAQLFDGMFFLALGPAAVNGILGKSYKDGPSIIVSGRAPSLEECLVQFTTATVGSVRQAALKADPAIRPDSVRCAGGDDELTLRPLEYSAFGTTVTRSQALGFDAEFYRRFTERMASAGTGDLGESGGSGETKAQVIASTFAAALHGEEDAGASCRFLAQRWQEWIDAERAGLVLYENQNDEEARKRAGSKGFMTHFGEYVERHARAMRDQCRGLRGPDVDCFLRTLESISGMPKRSDAFMCIKRSKLPERDHMLSRQMLRDWYQLVYQQTMARHLGAQLIAVDAERNSFAQIAGQASGSASMMLSGAITQMLGGMPFVRFATLCYECRGTIAAWRACTPDMSRRRQRVVTRNMAYSIEQASQETSLIDDAKGMAGGAAIAAILAFVSAMSDNVWLNGNAPIWMIVVAAWFIGIVPDLLDLGKWVWGVRSSSKTVVYMA